MTAAKACEIAIADTLRAFCEVGPDTVIRAWQSLRNDPAWEQDDATNSDRVLPCIDVRCAAPSYDASQRTMSVVAEIVITTDAARDTDHARISGIYEAVQATIDAMFDSAIEGNHTDDEIAAFLASLATNAPLLTFGGISLPDGNTPTDFDGDLEIGIGVRIHLSR
jgi:hypothetical protein